MSDTEARIHFELYRHLKNALDKGRVFGETTYGDVEAEFRANGGFADIVVFSERKDPILVIEAKREHDGSYRRNIDPYAPEVIRQAFRYAGLLGAEYFATYNGRNLVLFKTYEKGVPLMQRKSRSYRVSNIQEFAPTLLSEVAGVEAGTVKWDPADEAFVQRLVTLHGLMLEDTLASVSDSSKQFHKQLGGWVRQQGWELSDEEAEQRFAAQYAYLLMNKILFHKILEDSKAYRVPKLAIKPQESVEKQLKSAFDHVVKTVDFEPIYEHDPLFDALPLAPKSREDVREFIQELERYDLTTFDKDVIGRVYENVIPAEDRHRLGQYYTPPKVVDLICRLTIRKPTDYVMDPACGSGGFLVGAYNRLGQLKKSEGGKAPHVETLKQIFGVDINRFPAHLSAINLALRDLNTKTRVVNIEVEDFFHFNPGQQKMARTTTQVGTGQKPKESKIPTLVDAIVANPPYINQKLIADKGLARKHLARVKVELNEQSDIYCYFFTHASEFLRAGGRMGFITSNLWLSVNYGQPLRTWFCDRFKVLAVIHPSRRVFEGQLIATCITILEECSDVKTRDENLVRFLMVKSPLPIQEIAGLLERPTEPRELHSDPRWRMFSVPQNELRDETRWHRFLYAPPVYWRLIQHNKLVMLKDLADTPRGITTGANEFFIVDKETAKDYGIRDENLRPIATSSKEFEGLSPKAGALPFRLLDLAPIVKQSRANPKRPSVALQKLIDGACKDFEDKIEAQNQELAEEKRRPKPRRLNEVEINAMAAVRLRDEGAFTYLLAGLKQGVYDLETCKARGVWFDLGALPESRGAFPKNVRGRPFFPVLDRPTALLNVLYYLKPHDDASLECIAAFLNSSVGKLFFETQGRLQRGGLIEVSALDVAEFPILDPRVLTGAERKRIELSYQALLAAGVHEDEAPDLLLDLDKAILVAFGLEDRADEVAASARAMANARSDQLEFEVPVEAEKSETLRVPGGLRVGIRQQISLRDF